MSQPSEFEILGRVTIGQYLPTGSMLHRIDPRAKLPMALLLVIATIASASLAGLLLLLAAVVAGLVLARISLRFALDGLRPVLPFLLILALLQVFAISQFSARAQVLWHWSFLRMTDRSLLAGVQLILRFAILALGLSLFSFCTTTTELTHGIEHLLRPAQALGLPAHEFALVINIAIRFVPILAQEAERLMKAQASRGAGFGRGQRNLIQRTLKLLPLMVPLFLASLQAADDLTEAMEARGYLGGAGRSHLIELRAGPQDWFALFLSLVVASSAIAASFLGVDRALWFKFLVR